MSEDVDFEALGERLARLWAAPEALRDEAHWLRRAWLRLAGPRRDPSMEASALRGFAEEAPTLDRWRDHRASVAGELARNVDRLERAARSGRPPPTATVDWCLGVQHWALAMDRAWAAPSRHARRALTQGIASLPGIGRALEGGRQAGSVLALAGVDALIDEAAAETERINRRRRLLQAARRLLLEGEAAARDREPFASRRRVVARELDQLRRLVAAGPRDDRDLSEQLRAAQRRGDSRQVLAVCAASAYLRAGSRRPISRALAALAEGLDVDGSHALPARAQAAVDEGFAKASEHVERALEVAGPSDAVALRRRRGELGADARRALLRMVLGVDGFFDVGGGVEREQVDSPVASVERVPFPTPAMELHQGQHPRDVVDAILDDPRLLIHHLATRRLLVRRFRRRRVRRARRPRVRAAVRFYLLDGSGSMLGDRARMRDGILVAELASLVSRLERPTGRVHSLLYYRYFNSAVEPTRRVATVAEALGAIEHVLGHARSGGTDIQEALEDTLALIDEARRADVELTRAQVVLVTDGLAQVEPETIRELQERLDVPVRISIIVLGEDSEPLRRLATMQREAGLQVLYQQMGDAELRALAASANFGHGAVADAELTGAEGALDEHAGLDETAVDPLGADLAEEMAAAYAEVGLGLDALGEGERAKLEAARRDRGALERRFDRLFPALAITTRSLPDPDELERVAMLDALGVIAEVLELGTSEPAQAMADAIALLERLMRTRGSTLTEYLEVAREHPDQLGPAIDAIRLLCGRPAGVAASRSLWQTGTVRDTEPI